MWNEGRPNATDDYSVEFDGTYTNIGTNFQFESRTEFTGEVWFKTDAKVRYQTLLTDLPANYVIQTTNSFDEGFRDFGPEIINCTLKLIFNLTWGFG